MKETTKPVAFVAAGIVGAQAVFSLINDPGFLLRPPGAKSEEDFIARCITCGKCIEACPYVAIKVAPLTTGMSAGTPLIDAREQSCRLCEDFPCVAVCPTGALRDIEKRSNVRMGTAVVDEELCIAITKSIRCEVCYRTCPLINEAIDIEYRPREGDDKHVIFAPVVDAEKCVGCGLCVERCVVSDPAVAIRIEAPQGVSNGKKE
jgi:ferredoxin-type protein NapG